jgi:cupin fold WbuC family metalloprotein
MKGMNLSSAMLDQLIEEAERSPRRRQHRNAHASHQEPVQRLFNAICVDSYIRPHRHLADPKTETLLAIRGLFTFVTFTEKGEVAEAIRFGQCGAEPAASPSIGVEIPPGVWHTVIAEQPGSVVFEVKAGPFDPDKAKEWAEWAPTEGTPEAADYLAALRRHVASMR